MPEPEPFDRTVLQTFRFWISLVRSPSVPAKEAPAPPTGGPSTDHLGDGGFQECSGLELEADVKEYLEGGRNDGVIRRVGRVKLAPIVLKRGMFTPSAGDGSTPATVRPELWLWLQGMVTGELPAPRYNGLVEVMDTANRTPMARWEFVRGLPQKVAGPTLDARTGAIAVEELHIVHEGLRMVVA